MAKRKIVIAFMIFIMAAACLFFPLRSQSSSNAAQIENISGNKFVLTERVGYEKKHYFVDDNGKETFVNAKVKKDGEYYSVVSKDIGASFGYSEVSLTNDMKPFIEEGVLYVQASANVSTEGGKFKIIISSGTKTQKVETSTLFNGLIKTPLLKIEDFDKNIRFTFEMSGGKFEMKMPTIQIHTQIDEVVLNEEEVQTVSPGQMISVDAYNVVTQLSGATGNFMSFSKINHAIQFNIKKGEDLVKVVGTKLVISEDAKTGDEIIFNVYSNKNSYSSETISSSNSVTLVVNAESVIIAVDKHFADAATIIGEGQYDLGRTITLRVVPNKGYEFLGWYINGVEQTTGKTLRLENVTKGMQIFAKFKKTISIQSITVKRVYDGTSTQIIKDNVEVLFNGLEPGDALSLSGIDYENCSFQDANVGTKKQVTMSYTELALLDANDNVSDIYALSGQIPEVEGEITKREVTITTASFQKEYGDSDPILPIYSTQNIVAGESLKGNLSREKAKTLEGEKLGRYKITLGDLETQNPNYRFVFSQDEYLEVVKRTLYLQNVAVKEKVYDGTCSATITADLQNVYNNQDVQFTLHAEFVSANASDDVEVRILSYELYGKDKDNYTLAVYSDSIFGKIAQKPLTITAYDCNFTYGDKIEFNYLLDGLVQGESLSIVLEIPSKDVGVYQITLKRIENPNYEIEYISGQCVISKKDLFVESANITKIYADTDLPLTYSANGLIEGDTLSGGLVREEGQDVGQYKILLGDLSNDNYNIIYTQGIYEILPREIIVEITFKDREYDGTDNVDFDVIYLNNVKNEDFDFELEFEQISKDCGIKNIKTISYSVNNVYGNNYTFEYNFVNDKFEIKKRKVTVFVDAQSKTYGESDPILIFAIHGEVAGEFLDFEVSRQPGEDVGKYSCFIDEAKLVEYSNYEISLAAVEFEIIPKQIDIFIESQQKYFGDEDPTIEFSVQGEFEFGQTSKEVIDGKILRDPGENVGIYNFNLSELSSSKNYIFVNTSNTNFIIVKRPVFVTIADAEKVYGDEDPIFKYEVTNAIDGERLNVQIHREFGEDVGEYILTCGTTNDARYQIEFEEAKLKIIPYTIKIKADDKVKIYGEVDPSQSITITSGYLKNNDRLDDLIRGNLQRVEGEDVGSYEIGLGTFSLGENYNLEFESGKLQILQRRIVITPVENSKVYGDADPEFNYEVSGESMVFGDSLSGSLSRERGENVGLYEFTLSTLTAGDNYLIEFVKKNFEILKRHLQIIPTTLSKEYGDEDVEIKYQIVGQLVEGDVLSGTVYREKDKYEIERTGKYKILSSLENPNYEVELQEQYFTILPREIVIQADDFQIRYGDEKPKLTYNIISGTLLDGDTIRGELTWSEETSVGTYDIINGLTIGQNYNIIFIKGTVQILPRDLTIKSVNYTKIYGQEDPRFDYEIIEGELLGGDRLYGSVMREIGEDIGIYLLVNGLFNSNYNITLLPAYMEILKKDVYMISQIYDKIYDGSTKAILKNPHVSGLIDDVYLLYDIKNCADFESAQVGENIKVLLHDITLGGEKAFNYNLILPTELYASITLQEIVNDAVKVSSKDPVLYEDCQLQISSENIKNATKIENHKLVLEYDIWIESNEVEVSSEGLYTITINLPQSVFAKNNIYVYQKNANGEVVRVLSSKDEDGNIVITANSLGHFYITVEDDSWMNYATLASIIMLFILIIYAFYCVIKKLKKRKN